MTVMRCGFLILFIGMLFLGGCSGRAGPEETKRRAEYGRGKRLMVIYYGADWCGPCVAMKDDWKRFQQEFTSIYAQYVDYDRDTYRAKMDSVSILPTVIVQRNGLEIRRVQGRQSFYDLMRLVGYW